MAWALNNLQKVDMPLNKEIKSNLNLNDNSYKPLSKTKATPTYIIVSSNHPVTIVKEIPNSIDIRINGLSSPKNIFDNHRGFYNEALHNISYKNELMYL